jgi:anti-sigma factor RsiW
MNEHDHNQEQQINALLDGELDDKTAGSLKRAASEDQELARAIIEAYQLQMAMEQAGVEPAPASLRKRLRRIPREQRPAWQQPRWAMALATIPLVVITVLLMQSRDPSPEQVEQARRDLAVAFTYIGKIGSRTGTQMESQLGKEFGQTLTEKVIENVPGLNKVSEEEKA